jgi:hypothetical protein
MSIFSLRPYSIFSASASTPLWTTAQSQGVFGFVEKELPIEWVEVGV